MLEGAQLNGLVRDSLGNVYITGRTASRRSDIGSDDVLVAGLSDNGSRLWYVGRFGGSGTEEGRTISVEEGGNWVVVAGETESTNFLAAPATKPAKREVSRSFVIALEPCASGIAYARVGVGDVGDGPQIAISPALDVFARRFPGALLSERGSDDRTRPRGAVQTAPKCQVSRP